MKDKVIVVAGPTAVGKTQYAIDMAKEIGGEIVSLDSVQVYKYLDIGSAKPTSEEMQGIKHYMIDEVEPSINLNVKEYKDMAEKYIDKILKEKKTPILVGGTGFYIRAVLYDTDFLYEDENEANEIREALNRELSAKGSLHMYDLLKEIDPESVMKIPIGNMKRVLRAIEFYKLHGYPISRHNREEKAKECKYDVDFYVLNMDRERLYDRINKRIDIMIEKGLLKEVKSLINMGLSKDLNSMKSIGYNELYDFCKDHDTIYDVNTIDSSSSRELKLIVEKIKQQTRNYAKRQLTWFRAQENVKWVNL